MTELKLLPRREFQLVFDDGTVYTGQFGTWSLNRFAEKRKLSLPDAIAFFNNPQVALSDMLDFVVCAVEYKQRRAGQPISFNDLKLCEWLDAHSDATGESGILTKIFSHSGDAKEEEKKSPDDHLSGTNSSATPPVQE